MPLLDELFTAGGHDPSTGLSWDGSTKVHGSTQTHGSRATTVNSIGQPPLISLLGEQSAPSLADILFSGTPPPLGYLLNAFCATGVGGGVNPHCPSGGGAAASPAPAPPVGTHGVPVGHSLTKSFGGRTYTVTATATGFSVSNPVWGHFGTFSSLTAAAQAVRSYHGQHGAVNGWAFFGSPNPKAVPRGAAAPATPAASPTPIPAPPPPPARPFPGAPGAGPIAPATPAAATPGAVHAGSGLPIGATYSKRWKGVDHTIRVTHAGFEVTYTHGPSVPPRVYTSLSAAATGIKGNRVPTNGWTFFGIRKPAGTAATPARIRVPAPAPTPTPAPASPLHAGANVIGGKPAQALPSTLHSTIPFSSETSWETGKPQSGVVLNGVPFAPAPHHFWEHVKDVDVKEPPPVRPIVRVGIMIKEPDGRVWVVEPTNHFGSRNHTLPGGHVEPGLTDQQNALKEVWEETGLQCKITGHLADVKDSNNGNYGRLYLGERIGGAPWDAKPEPGKIPPSVRNGSTAESESVKLVTPERAAQLLHRTDDLAQLATVHPIKVNAKPDGAMMQKIVEGVQPAASKYIKSMHSRSLHAGDSTFHVVQELRGFNGRPNVASRADMDALVKQGTHIEMLRGVKPITNYSTGASVGAQTLTDEFKNGAHFPGGGVFGTGTYFDATRGTSNVADSYSRNYGSGKGDIIRVALPKTAKIIKQSELEKAVGYRKPTGYGKGRNANGSDEENWHGVQAALAGYDAIHVDGKSSHHGSYGNPSHSSTEGFYIVLNRSILTVQRESAVGHVIR